MTDRLSHSQFERLAADILPALRGRLTRRFKDAYLADSVATDSLSAAWDKYQADPEYFTTNDLAGWMGRLASWRALDDLRRRNKTAALAEEHQGEDEEAAKAPDAPAVAPDTSALEWLQTLVYHAVQSLPVEDRFLLEGMSYESLTDQAMGVTLFGEADGTAQARGLRVFRRRQRALGRLRDRLLEWGFDEEAWRAGLAV